MCNKSGSVFRRSQEKPLKRGTKGTQFQVFSWAFSSTVSYRGIGGKADEFTWERDKCKTDPPDILKNSNSADARVGQ